MQNLASTPIQSTPIQKIQWFLNIKMNRSARLMDARVHTMSAWILACRPALKCFSHVICTKKLKFGEKEWWGDSKAFTTEVTERTEKIPPAVILSKSLAARVQPVAGETRLVLK